MSEFSDALPAAPPAGVSEPRPVDRMLDPTYDSTRYSRGEDTKAKLACERAVRFAPQAGPVVEYARQIPDRVATLETEILLLQADIRAILARLRALENKA